MNRVFSSCFYQTNLSSYTELEMKKNELFPNSTQCTTFFDKIRFFFNLQPQLHQKIKNLFNQLELENSEIRQRLVQELKHEGIKGYNNFIINIVKLNETIKGNSPSYFSFGLINIISNFCRRFFNYSPIHQNHSIISPDRLSNILKLLQNQLFSPEANQFFDRQINKETTVITPLLKSFIINYQLEKDFVRLNSVYRNTIINDKDFYLSSLTEANQFFDRQINKETTVITPLLKSFIINYQLEKDFVRLNSVYRNTIINDKDFYLSSLTDTLLAKIKTIILDPTFELPRDLEDKNFVAAIFLLRTFLKIQSIKNLSATLELIYTIKQFNFWGDEIFQVIFKIQGTLNWQEALKVAYNLDDKNKKFFALAGIAETLSSKDWQEALKIANQAKEININNEDIRAFKEIALVVSSTNWQKAIEIAYNCESESKFCVLLKIIEDLLIINNWQEALKIVCLLQNDGIISEDIFLNKKEQLIIKICNAISSNNYQNVLTVIDVIEDNDIKTAVFDKLAQIEAILNWEKPIKIADHMKNFSENCTLKDYVLRLIDEKRASIDWQEAQADEKNYLFTQISKALNNNNFQKATELACFMENHRIEDEVCSIIIEAIPNFSIQENKKDKIFLKIIKELGHTNWQKALAITKKVYQFRFEFTATTFKKKAFEEIVKITTPLSYQLTLDWIQKIEGYDQKLVLDHFFKQLLFLNPDPIEQKFIIQEVMQIINLESMSDYSLGAISEALIFIDRQKALEIANRITAINVKNSSLLSLVKKLSSTDWQVALKFIEFIDLNDRFHCKEKAFAKVIKDHTLNNSEVKKAVFKDIMAITNSLNNQKKFIFLCELLSQISQSTLPNNLKHFIKFIS